MVISVPDDARISPGLRGAVDDLVAALEADPAVVVGPLICGKNNQGCGANHCNSQHWVASASEDARHAAKEPSE
jgi:hypothetical protein